MLRNSYSRQCPSEQTRKIKRRIRDERTSVPLGGKKLKEDTEKELESLVLGGEHQILEDVLLTEDRKFAGIKRDEESKITKKEYSHRLKSQFEKLSSTPNWAKLPSERKPQSDSEDSDVEELLQKTGTFLDAPTSLPRGIIQVKPCTDLNKENYMKGGVQALEFHPSAQVALTGGSNNTLTLFQVDGKTNPKIQSFFLENYPITCAHFSRDGEQVIIGSNHKAFKYLDMIAGKVVNVPYKGMEEKSMNKFVLSPDGKYIVFLGKYGRMHFISSKSKEWLFTLTMNGSVQSVAFTSDGQQMYSHGDDGQVYVWDVRTRECIHRFMDEGCTRGTCIAISPNDQYLACGSNTGVVNLYERESCLTGFEPRPVKAIMNLTSSCAIAKFNATSEILAIVSREEEKAIKLVHTASQTVFSNFPDNMDVHMKTPTAIDFSVNSGYLTLGTNRGKAMLYRLKHYGNY
ncbi:UTP18-like protein [Mya arenaria]|uniref:UTP18-like protein n=1 Tax=Mya arenaria TaxID=6604 RepID=A0ABY7E6X0_MYAAR|nr:UTP18-like protein [Mya arenaria]